MKFINLLSMGFILIFHLAGFVSQRKCHYSEINAFAEQGRHFSNFFQDKTVWSQEMWHHQRLIHDTVSFPLPILTLQALEII